MPMSELLENSGNKKEVKNQKEAVDPNYFRRSQKIDI